MDLNEVSKEQLFKLLTEALERMEIDKMLLINVYNGDMKLFGIDEKTGDMKYSLTEQGKDMAKRAIIENPECKDLWDRLNNNNVLELNPIKKN